MNQRNKNKQLVSTNFVSRGKVKFGKGLQATLFSKT